MDMTGTPTPSKRALQPRLPPLADEPVLQAGIGEDVENAGGAVSTGKGVGDIRHGNTVPDPGHLLLSSPGSMSSNPALENLSSDDGQANVSDDGASRLLHGSHGVFSSHSGSPVVLNAVGKTVEEEEDLDALTLIRFNRVGDLLHAIAQGKIIDSQDEQGASLAHIAAQSADSAALDALIGSATSSAFGEDDTGQSPLHYAAQAGSEACVRYLLQECHVNSSGVDKAGTTALHFAAAGGHSRVCSLLCDWNPSAVFDSDSLGQTALHHAAHCLNVQNAISCVRCLLAVGALTDAENNAGKIPEACVRDPRVGNVMRGMPPDWKTEAGTDNGSGPSAQLAILIERGDIVGLESQLSHGNPDEYVKEGLEAFDACLKHPRGGEFLSILLDYGCLVPDMRDGNGKSLIFRALEVQAGHVVHALVRWGGFSTSGKGPAGRPLAEEIGKAMRNHSKKQNDSAPKDSFQTVEPTLSPSQTSYLSESEGSNVSSGQHNINEEAEQQHHDREYGSDDPKTSPVQPSSLEIGSTPEQQLNTTETSAVNVAHGSQDHLAVHSMSVNATSSESDKPSVARSAKLAGTMQQEAVESGSQYQMASTVVQTGTGSQQLSSASLASDELQAAVNTEEACSASERDDSHSALQYYASPEFDPNCSDDPAEVARQAADIVLDTDVSRIMEAENVQNVDASEKPEPDNVAFGSLISSASCGAVDVLDGLLKHYRWDSGRADQPGADGQTALMTAVRAGHSIIVEMLIGAGADVNVRDKSNSGFSILHHAVEMDQPMVCSCLLSVCPTLASAKDSTNRTALELAIESSRFDCIASICKNAPESASVPCSDGSTVLICLCRKLDHFDSTVSVLSACPSLISQGDAQGRSPLQVAHSHGHSSTAMALAPHRQNISGLDMRELMNDIQLSGDSVVFIEACIQGDVAGVSQCLQLGSDPSLQLGNSLSVIHLAAAHGHTNVMDQLLLAGADVFAGDASGLSALHVAAANGFDFLVSQLSEGRKSLVNAKSNDGFSALHLATMAGHSQCVKILLQSSADLDAMTKSGSTAAHIASKFNFMGCLSALADFGANFTRVDVNGRTPLHVAALAGSFDAVSFLVQLPNAALESQDNYGDSPLHCAVVGAAGPSIVQILLEYGCPPTMYNMQGATAQSLAQSLGRHDMLDCFQKFGQSESKQSSLGLTDSPLHTAARNGQADRILSLLQSSSERPDVVNNQLCTPLHMASMNGHVDIVKLLLEHGATASARDDRGFTAAHYAAGEDNAEILQLLAQRDLSCLTSQAAVVTSAVSDKESGDNVSTATSVKHVQSEEESVGWTPLHVAASSNSCEALRFLLRMDPSSVDSPDLLHCTPLHVAAFNGFDASCRLLLSFGAQLMTRDAQGRTPGDAAAAGGHHGLESTLSSLGSAIVSLAVTSDTPALAKQISALLAMESGHDDLDNTSKNSNVTILSDALRAAAMEGQVENCKLLIKHGAMSTKLDNESMSAIHYAAAEEQSDILELFANVLTAEELSVSGPGGLSALHLACGMGLQSSVQILCDSLPVQAMLCVDEKGCTPFHVTVAEDLEDIFRILIRALSDLCGQRLDEVERFLSKPDSEGCSVIEILETVAPESSCGCLWSSIRTHGFQYAIGEGDGKECNESTVTAGSDSSVPVLHRMVTEVESARFSNEIMCGAQDIHVRDKHGLSALHVAVLACRVNAAKALLESDLNVDVIDSEGLTPLHYAASQDFPAMVSLLLNHGAGQYQPTFSGRIIPSPLHCSVYGKQSLEQCRSALSIALRRPWMCFSLDAEQKTAIDAAQAPDIREILYSLGCADGRGELGRCSSRPSAWWGDLSGVIEQLHTAALSSEQSAFLESCFVGVYNKVSSFIDQKAAKWSKLTAEAKVAAFLLCVVSGNVTCVARILATGDVSPECCGPQSVTAMHLAIAGGREAVARFIALKAPRTIFASDSAGFKAYQYSRQGSKAGKLVASALFQVLPHLVDNEEVFPEARKQAESRSRILKQIKGAILDANVDFIADVFRSIDWAYLGFAIVDEPGNTCIHFAARNNCFESLSWLIHEGPHDLSQRIVSSGLNVEQLAENIHNEGFTPLHSAAAAGSVPCLELLSCLEQSCDLLDARGYTSLDIAAANGQLGAVQFLISEGKSRVECGQSTQGCALHIAVDRGEPDIVQSIVSSQPWSLILKDGSGSTPLHLLCHKAAIRGSIVVNSRLRAIAGRLLDAGACPFILDDNGQSPFDLASQSASHVATSICTAAQNATMLISSLDALEHHTVEWPAVIASASAAHACIIGTNQQCDTAMHIAALKGLEGLAAIASRKGCNPNLPNTEGDTPLHIACRHGMDKVVRILLAVDANPNIQNLEGQTAAHICLVKGQDTCFKLLLSHKDMFGGIPDGAGVSVFEWCIRLQRFDDAQALVVDNRCPPLDSLLANGRSVIQELIQQHPPGSTPSLPMQRLVSSIVSAIGITVDSNENSSLADSISRAFGKEVFASSETGISAAEVHLYESGSAEGIINEKIPPSAHEAHAGDGLVGQQHPSDLAMVQQKAAAIQPNLSPKGDIAGEAVLDSKVQPSTFEPSKDFESSLGDLRSSLNSPFALTVGAAGNYQVLEQALQKARAGDTIFLVGAVAVESIELDKAVTIKGAGSEPMPLEWDVNCQVPDTFLCVQAPRIRFDNVIFKFPKNGIKILEGSARFINCKFECIAKSVAEPSLNCHSCLSVATGAGIDASCCSFSSPNSNSQCDGIVLMPAAQAMLDSCVFGPLSTGLTSVQGCSPQVTATSFSSCSISAVTFSGASAGTLTRCTMQGGANSLCLLKCEQSSNPRLVQCSMSDSTGIGILVTSQARPDIRNCRIYGCSQPCVVAEAEGDPQLFDCELGPCEDCTVLIGDHGHGRLSRSTVVGSSTDGIQVQEGGRLSVEQSTIRNCDGCGIVALGECIIHVNSTDIIECKTTGIEAKPGSQVNVENGSLSQCRSEGIKASGSSSVHLRGVSIHSCKCTGVEFAGKEGNFSMDSCKVFDCSACLFSIRDGCKACIVSCQCYSSNILVEISDGSSPEISACQFSEAKVCGIACTAASKPLISRCKILDCSGVALKIDDGSDPLLRSCSVQQCTGIAGIVVDGQGQGTFEACEIFECKSSGVLVTRGGHPLLRQCTVHDCSGDGITVMTGGSPVLDECEIMRCTKAGVTVESSGIPFLRNKCIIRENKGVGLLFSHGALGNVSNCTFSGNGRSGVSICGLSSPSLSGCRLEGSQACGIHVYDGGKASVQDCDFKSMTGVGLKVETGGCPEVQNCRFAACGMGGALFLESAEGLIKSCDFTECEQFIVRVVHSSNPHFLRCSFHDTQLNAFESRDGARGMVQECEVWNCATGFLCSDESKTVFEQCVVRDGCGIGIDVVRGSHCTFKEVMVVSTFKAGVRVRGECQPSFIGCEVSDSGEAGFLLSEHGCRPTLKNCSANRCRGAGIACCDGSEAQVEACHVEASKDSGLLFVNGAKGTFSEVTASKCIMAGCSLSSSCSPTLKQCKFFENNGHGVYSYDSGSGSLVMCEMTGNAFAGFMADTQGSCDLISCKLDRNCQAGLAASDGGSFIAEKCEMQLNKEAGVYIGRGSNPSLKRCIVVNTDGCGMFFRDGGMGAVDDCRITSSKLAGVVVSFSANPKLTSCVISKGLNAGIVVSDDGLGQFSDCDVFDNAAPGVSVRSGGSPSMEEVSVHGGADCGLLVYQEGKGKFFNCTFAGNAKANVAVESGGVPALTRCQVQGGKDAGILCYEGGVGEFERCEVFETIGDGIVVETNSDPSFRHCQIHHCGSRGVYFRDSSLGLLDSCEVHNNTMAGVAVASRSHPVVRNNIVRDGQASGIFVFEGGRGVFEGNRTYGNAMDMIRD